MTVHSQYFSLKVGDRYGRFNEAITRAEHLSSDAPTPAWFDPLGREGHLGIHESNDSVYLELAIDEEARYADHAFAEVEDASEHIVQISFF